MTTKNPTELKSQISYMRNPAYLQKKFASVITVGELWFVMSKDAREPIVYALQEMHGGQADFIKRTQIGSENYQNPTLQIRVLKGKSVTTKLQKSVILD